MSADVAQLLLERTSPTHGLLWFGKDMARPVGGPVPVVLGHAWDAGAYVVGKGAENKDAAKRFKSPANAGFRYPLAAKAQADKTIGHIAFGRDLDKMMAVEDGYFWPDLHKYLAAHEPNGEGVLTISDVEDILPLTGSVGEPKTPAADHNVLINVRRVQSRLRSLGFRGGTMTKHSRLGVDGAIGDQTIKAIRLFQAIVKGTDRFQNKNGTYTDITDGRIDTEKGTHRNLRRADAPRWQRMLGGVAELGYLNYEIRDTTEHFDYGTRVMAEFLENAGISYRLSHMMPSKQIESPITINDVTLPTGGYTGDHSGHQTGLAADFRLARDDGMSMKFVTEVDDSAFDRDAMRAMLQAMRKQPRFEVAYLEDPRLISEGLCFYSPGHHNHLHVSIHPRPAAPTKATGHATVPSKAAAFIQTHETATKTMYLDAKKRLSIGRHHRPSDADVLSLPFVITATQRVATRKQIKEEIKRVRNAEDPTLELPAAEIERLLLYDAARAIRRLKPLFPYTGPGKKHSWKSDFDRYPMNVRIALCDLAFDLESGIQAFRKMLRAVKAMDWTTAAAESARKAASKERNKAVKDLFAMRELKPVDARRRSEWNDARLSSVVRTIVEKSVAAATLWTGDFRITSIFRTAAEDAALGGSGVHVAWRAVDVGAAGQSAAAIKEIADFANDRWAYDPARPAMLVCVSKPHGTGPHLHFQVHPNTAPR